MKTVKVLFFMLGCIGLITLREVFGTTTNDTIEKNGNQVLRKLWEPSDDSKAADTCDGVSFKGKTSSSVDSIIDSISTQRNSGENLKQFADDSEIVDYLLSLLRYIVPWAVLFLFSLIAAPIFCCLNYGCCCCCGYPESPGKVASFVMLILFLACSVTIVGLSIAGLCYSATLKSDYNRLKCSIYIFVNEAISGASEEFSPGSNWAGVTGVCEMAEGALAGLNGDEFADISDSVAGNVKADYTTAEAELQTIVNSYSSPPTAPHPGTGIPIPLEIFVAEPQSGPLAPLYYELYAYKEVISSVLYSVYEGGESLNQGGQASIDSAKEAILEVGEFTDEIDSFKEDIYDYADMGDTPIKAVQIGLTVFYAVVIGSVCITVIGTVLFVFLKMNRLRCIGTIGCTILTILMIIGFLVTAVVMPLSVVFIEACDMIHLDHLEENHDLIPESAWEYLSVCLVGDGDMYTARELDQQIDFADQTSEGLELFESIYDNTRPGCKLKYGAIQGNKTIYENIKDKRPLGAAPKALASFNVGNLPNIYSGCTSDSFVWHKDDCANPTDLIDTTNLVGTCFAIMSTQRTLLDTHYTGATCDALKDAVRKVYAYVDDVDAAIQALLDNYDTMTNALDDANSDGELCQIADNIAGLSAFDEIKDAMEILSVELVEGLDCSFMRDSFSRVYDATCGPFTQGLTFIAIFIGVISAMSVLLIIFLLCVNRRFREMPIEPYDKTPS